MCYAAVEKVREGAKWSGTLSFSPLTSIKTGMWWKERMGHKSFSHPINIRKIKSSQIFLIKTSFKPILLKIQTMLSNIPL